MTARLPYGTHLPANSGPAEAAAEPTQTIAVITGGARGIGRHLATAFARTGYHVVLTATAAETAEATADTLRAETAGSETGGAVAGHGLIVDDAESVHAFRDAMLSLESETGRSVQVLVNNAGRIESTEGPLWKADPASLSGVIGANVLGVALMINAFAPVLIDRAQTSGRPSRIIDLNSGSGATGTPAYAAYSASKAALFRIADSVVHFGHEAGLRIFEMAPGVVETEMTRSMPVHDFREEGDWTTPEQVSDLAVALASGELDAFTGRYVRAGADTVEALRAEAAAGLSDTARRLVLG